MTHAQRIEKNIRLTFNAFTSDDNFIQRSMSILHMN